jgi:hypothetical protein
LGKVLLLALILSALGVVGRASAARLFRVWDGSTSAGDVAWSDRPWCLSPSRPYLCLFEYRLRAGGLAAFGLDGLYDELGAPPAPGAIPLPP